MSAEPRTVVLVANGLTLGGTEKGLVAHAVALDRTRFRPRVVGLHELGPRRQSLDAAGVRVDCAHGDRDRLARLLRGADIVHVWRSGTGERVVAPTAREAGAPVVVESNVFGLVDPAADAVDCRLFLSRSCAVRYRRRGGPEPHVRHGVLPLPLDHEALVAAAPPRADAKRSLGIDPLRPVVGRFGRADDMTWRNLLVDMIPPLLALRPDAQPLLVGSTPSKRRRLERRGVLHRCLLREPVADPDELAALYAACDVTVSAAELGESQGLAVAEAMALGIPVVTCSTPWVNNAQIEYVEHGRTGYVANHPRPFAEAISALLADDALRERLGAAARAKVTRSLDVGALTRQLENVYESLLSGDDRGGGWASSSAELEAFEAQEPERAREEFRPLGPRERIEARRAREGERFRRWAGLLRPRMLPLAWSMLRARVRPVPRGPAV